ncbi:MED7 protein-domain-containing protein [Suillus bovinus]|uniref:MED7 protein-domain-containing protein n=1 Tax=Suillus bovinus TaxID=48563 RepID=UPI001B8623A4|nr:MED7 protein-domain-containing protein [Suillus bovinus]KAG2159647.1 MED7 protein-domain-containing protein [Suillus bovinus]
MDEEEAELRSPFPSPPSHYNNYTSHNLKLLALLKERVRDQNANIGIVDQHELLSDQSDVPTWSLSQLEKPRVDWILEEGHYSVFGDTWFVKETIPSLAECGVHQLYPPDPSVDRRPALLAVLRSMLVTYSNLTKAVLAPPPPPSSSAQPEWQRQLEWIAILAQNLMAAANDLRPVQARGNLELMMQRQLELRREEAKNIHSQCDTLEARLLELRSSAQEMVGLDQKLTAKPSSSQVQISATNVSLEDMLRWAEEVP